MPLGGLKALGKEPAASEASLEQRAEGQPPKDSAASEQAPAEDRKHHDGYKRQQGSYRHYYSYRHGPDGSLSGLDRRLEAILDPSVTTFFSDKEVLDV